MSSTRKTVTGKRITKRKLIPPQPIVLTFTAKMVSNNSDDALREFQLTFQADTSMFAVYEKQVPNSGFPGGKFIRATKINNPETGKPYKPDEVTLGKDVVLNGWKFHLAEASEGTLKSMETHSDMFTRSNSTSIMLGLTKAFRGKIDQVTAEFQRDDPNNHGRVKQSRCKEILEQFNANLGEQELLTLFRQYSFANTDEFKYRDFLTNFK